MTTTTAVKPRDYDRVIARLKPAGSREERMQASVDALWDELHDKRCSWIGFYLKCSHSDEMILGPRRDKPACSPIGMFGACGRSFNSRKPLIVTDVVNLHAGYIACDPRDRSECVLPVLEGYDKPYAVLDVDSYDTFAFNRDDIMGLHRVLRHMDLTIDLPMGEIETV